MVMAQEEDNHTLTLEERITELENRLAEQEVVDDP